MADIEIEPSVQMRLYTLNKRHFALVFLAAFIFFIITVVIGLLGPPIMEYTKQNASDLTNYDIAHGPFHIKSPPVSTFHQQLWLTARIVLDHNDGSKIEWPFSIGVLIRGLVEDSASDSGDVVYDGQKANHSRTLLCAKECEHVAILHLGFLAYPRYIITVNIYGLDTLKYPISNIDFVFTTYNAAFTQLEIWFRFTYLVLTFIATCWFAHSLRKFSLHDWSMEQKWITFLLPLLLLYDNPIFPLTFLLNSWLPSMCDVVFQATFYSALLLFWLCLYHGVRQNKRKWSTFYLPKLLLVGLIWILVITLFSWQGYQELNDPTYNFILDNGHLMAVQITFIVFVSIYLLYLIYLLVRAYAELRSMPYFDLRLKVMTSLMLIVILLSVMIVVMRFGVNALPVAATVSKHFNNSAEFVALYSLLNVYFYTMSFVYSPSKNAVFESHFKDNPALSMLNDSDDDIVYGESTALTSCKTPGAKYDSDEEAFN